MKMAQNIFQNALRLHCIQIAHATKIQTLFRKMRHRRYFQNIRRCALRIQYYYGFYRQSKRLHGAALSLQKHIRGYNARKAYKNVRACAIKIQCFVRYCQANTRRQKLLESLKLKRATSACTIQSKFRMYYCANRYAIQKAQAIKIQSMLQNAQPKISLQKYDMHLL